VDYCNGRHCGLRGCSGLLGTERGVQCFRELAPVQA
jgi:hypothetical protein